MGVTVQLMVDALVSGVMFTCNPVSGDPSTVAVNASWGLGSAVVAGEVTPDEYRINKVSARGDCTRTIGPKEVEDVPHPEGAGTVRLDVPPSGARRACLDDESLGRAARGGAAHRAPLRRPPGHRVGDLARRRAARAAVAAGHRRARPRSPSEAQSALSLVMKTFGADRQDLMALTEEDVREILRLIDESELDELRIETDEFKLHVVRGEAAAADGSRPTRRRRPRPRGRPAARPTTIDAPMPGTFYRAEGPGPAAVRGDRRPRWSRTPWSASSRS